MLLIQPTSEPSQGERRQRAGQRARALLLAVLCMLAAPVTAAPVWVFVDNSGSMHDLARTYLIDMQRLISDGKPEQLYFAAIEGGGGGIRAVSSANAGSGSALKQIFTFKGPRSNTTPIDESLRRGEVHPGFRDAERILIISDMDPDHRILGYPFHFSLDDIVDLQDTLKRLDRWLADGKRIRIVLHGWDQAPAATAYPAAELDRFPAHLQAEIDALRSAQAPSRWRAPGWDEDFHEPLPSGLTPAEEALEIAAISERRRALVARGLAHLAAKYPDTLELSNIAPESNGIPNHDGFRASLCDALLDDLGDAAAVCSGVAAIAAPDFRIRMDYSRLLLREDLRERVIQRFPRSISDGKMPRMLPKPEVGIGIGSEPDDTATVHLRIRPGQRGQPFNYPRIEAQGITRDGQVIELGPVQAEFALEDRVRMADWSVDAAVGLLQEFISAHYPPEMRYKKVFLRGEDGMAVSDGLYFQFIYDNANGDEGRSAVVASRDGLVEMELPMSFRQGGVFLVSQDGQVQSSGIYLQPGDVRSTADIDRQLGSGVLRTAELSFCLKDGTDCAPYPGAVSALLYRVNADNSREPVPLDSPDGARLRPIGTGARLERLFPGNYVVEVLPLASREYLANNAVYFDAIAVAGQTDPVPVAFEQDMLAQGWQDSAYGFTRIQNGFRLSRSATDHLRGSAYYLQRLLEHSNTLLNDEPRLDTAGTPEHAQLRDLWRALRDEIFDGNRSSSYSRWLTRSLEPFFPPQPDGSLPPGSMQQLRAFFDRFIDCRSDLLDAEHYVPGAVNPRRYAKLVRNLRDNGFISDAFHDRVAQARPEQECMTQ